MKQIAKPRITLPAERDPDRHPLVATPDRPSSVPDAESPFTGDRFITHLDAGHRGTGRTLSTPVEEGVNGIATAFGSHFDGAVSAVAHPTADGEARCHPLAAVAEEHTLNPTRDDRAASYVAHGLTPVRGSP